MKKIYITFSVPMKKEVINDDDDDDDADADDKEEENDYGSKEGEVVNIKKE